MKNFLIVMGKKGMVLQQFFFRQLAVIIICFYVHTMDAAAEEKAEQRSVADLTGEEIRITQNPSEFRKLDISYKRLTSLCGLAQLLEQYGSFAVNLVENKLGNSDDPLPCEGLESLRELFLTDNRLRVHHLTNFGCLTNLTYLNLASNKLAEVPPTIKKLTALHYLILFCNEITSIKSDDFTGLDDLRELHLANNQISSIESGAINLRNLGKLSLSGNKLTALKKGAIRGNNIQSLDCAWNEITHVEDGALQGLPVLRELHLEHNKITQLTPAAIAGPNNVALVVDHNLLSRV